MNMRTVFSIGAILLACALATISCKKKVVNPSSEGELFVGTYVYRIPSVVGLEKSDSMRLEIIGNSSYFAIFYSDSLSVQPNAMFCDHSGKVLNFGTNTANFVPSAFDAGNCDTLHTARGVFTAVFGAGGALTMTRTVGDTIFQFKLIKK
ncbi:MAG: hypothetical protein AAB305_01075 [Candidatus Zixiibacteriota bacterium]